MDRDRSLKAGVKNYGVPLQYRANNAGDFFVVLAACVTALLLMNLPQAYNIKTIEENINKNDYFIQSSSETLFTIKSVLNKFQEFLINIEYCFNI